LKEQRYIPRIDVDAEGLGRFYESGQWANSCARGSVCFCRQMETPVFVCLRRNC